MKMTFGQSSLFVAAWRQLRLTDDDLRELERQLMQSPAGGAVIQGTGGLRKMRFAPPSRGSGKRGGLRICYVHSLASPPSSSSCSSARRSRRI
jgi:hypothetical protein